jgi:hypothetical protein
MIHRAVPGKARDLAMANAATPDAINSNPWLSSRQYHHAHHIKTNALKNTGHRLRGEADGG